MPPDFAAFFRFAANFGERRRAGGVGSGSGVFSQTVAALAGPSISGFGAGFVFGSSTLRSWTHWDCASLCRPPGRFVLWPDELPAVELEDEPCVADELLLTCVKPRSDVPAVESGVAAESAGAEVSMVGAAESAGAVALDESAAGAAE